MQSPMYANLNSGTHDGALQEVVDITIVGGTAQPLTGAAPTINDQAGDFADLAAVTTAYNALLAALRTRGVIAGS